MQSLPELAEICRLACLVGLCGRDEVSRWAGEAIQTMDEPSPHLATLATEMLDRSELAACLQQLAQGQSIETATTPLLGYLYRRLCDDPANLDVVLSVCLRLVAAGALEGKLATHLDIIDEALHLAADGIVGSIDEVRVLLEVELERYGGADDGLSIRLSLPASSQAP